MAETLPDDYVAKALQDARRFQGCWDAGTSGSLAAHTYRFIREREGLLKTIETLEAANAALRAVVEQRQQGPAAAAAASVPADLPAAFTEANPGVTLVPATPVPEATFSPTLMRSSVPLKSLEAVWGGIKARRDAMLARASSEMPADHEIVREVRLPARRQLRIVGITGLAGAGKNLVASMVPGGTIVQLADPIYAMLEAMLGIPVEELRDRETKERVVESIGKSPRQLLQTLGTEWGRALVRDDIWLILCRKRIEALLSDGAEAVVVADVRFDNEAQMIRDMGGQVWEVVRPGLAIGDHASEQGVSPHLVDRRIDNTHTVDQLRRDVAAILEAR